MRMILTFIFVASGAVAINADGMRSSEKIGAVCRKASLASLTTGDAGDWLRTIRDAASGGHLSADEQTLLIRMCGVYAVAERDGAQAQLQEVKRRLQASGE